MSMAVQTRELADSLGLTGRHVFFNEGWVRYDDRVNFLLDADAGVSTHFSHLETVFSFRTRILDYLWAGLPILSTGGDSLGDLVGSAGLGVTVAERDVDGAAAAITRVLYDAEFAAAARDAVAAERGRFEWPTALAPLVAFCADPHRAPDSTVDPNRMARHLVPPSTALGTHLQRGTTLLREGGPALLARRAVARTRRVIAARRGGTGAGDD
jgi:hypothetical protein